jgi:hypothetical protein
MGHRGKLDAHVAARIMRAEGHTLLDIATHLGVSKSSVSVWVRDVPFAPSPRRRGPKRRTHPASIAKQRQIADLDRAGRDRIGTLSDDAFLAAGIALYAGEGSKRDGEVVFANTNPSMVAFFCAWLRRFFDVDESRLRVRVYLHQGLDLDAATDFWSTVTGIPASQFRRPYRAVDDGSVRRTKHANGCVSVSYGCTRTHRSIMGLIRALLISDAIPG